MKELGWIRGNWPLAVSVSTLVGLGILLARALNAAHGSGNYVLLLSGDNFLRAALVVGLEALTWIAVAGLVIIVPMQFANYEDDASRGTLLLISLASFILLAVISAIPSPQILTVTAVLISAFIIVEMVLVRVFARYDIGSPRELYERAERANIWRKKARSKHQAGHTPRPKKYREAAREFVVGLSVVLTLATCLFSLAQSDNMWLPLERVTLDSGLSIRGVYVVQEGDRWLTLMSAATGEFRQIPAERVDARIFCVGSARAGDALFIIASPPLPKC